MSTQDPSTLALPVPEPSREREGASGGILGCRVEPTSFTTPKCVHSRMGQIFYERGALGHGEIGHPGG